MITDPAASTAFYSRIDLAVNALTLIIQLGLTRWLLSRFGIAPALLDSPLSRVTQAQYARLVFELRRLTRDELWGLCSQPLPVGSFGHCASQLVRCQTLDEALRLGLRRYHGLLADFVPRLVVQGDEARLQLLRRQPWNARLDYAQKAFLLFAFGLACWLVDSRIPLLGASFPFAAPAHAEVYRVLFDGPTAFDADQTAIHFDARYLALPVKRDEAAMNQMLQRALPIQVRPYRRDRLLVQRVRQVLTTQPLDAHNANDLAALLNTSARTLHRQLKDEGATLQALKDEVRRDRALDLLQRTTRPIKQVAEAAGFQNQKSFMRAFKGWTGVTPGEWRAGVN